MDSRFVSGRRTARWVVWNGTELDDDVRGSVATVGIAVDQAGSPPWDATLATLRPRCGEGLRGPRGSPPGAGEEAGIPVESAPPHAMTSTGFRRDWQSLLFPGGWRAGARADSSPVPPRGGTGGLPVPPRCDPRAPWCLWDVRGMPRSRPTDPGNIRRSRASAKGPVPRFPSLHDDAVRACGRRHLRRDPVLAPLLRRWGDVWPRRRATAFGSLVGTIVGQQISTAAARSIHRRLRERFGARIRPDALESASDAELRACGLSRQKIRYLRSLCTHVLDGSLPLRRLPWLPEEEAAAHREVARLVAELGLDDAERVAVSYEGLLAAQVEVSDGGEARRGSSSRPAEA